MIALLHAQSMIALLPLPLPPFPHPVPPPSVAAAEVSLSKGVVARSSGPSYAGFTFDWHCGASDATEWRCKAEPGWNHSSVNFGLDLDNPGLIAATKTLAPARLRIGGSQGDFICYDVPAGSCAAKFAKCPSCAANSMAFVLNGTPPDTQTRLLFLSRW
jgi:hypothetical protein